MYFLLFSDDYVATHESDVHIEPRIILRSRIDQNPRVVRRQKSFESRSNSSEKQGADFNRRSRIQRNDFYKSNDDW